MKKFIALFCGIVSMVMMTSCWDEDTERSYHLSGSWDGYFGAYYEYQDRNGRWVSVDSRYSELEFLPAYDYATHGTGHEVDYYDRGPYDYQYYYFKWEIEHGVIYMTYPHNHELDVELHDYRLTNSYLSGRFKTGTRFQLDKYQDYYYGWHEDYLRYDCDNYGWWYNHGSITWSWAPERNELTEENDSLDTRGIETEKETTQAVEQEEIPIRVGRHI